MKDKIKIFNKPIIGMEIHTELRTDSKMFCSCSAYHFGIAANTNTCPVCLGLPGALPYPNKKALEWTMMIGLALKCNINIFSKFDRKHYFYPDLPKAYQLSQFDKPLCEGGFLDTGSGRVGITRVHIEEDTGKLQHTKINGKNTSLIDFNRSGVPLVEIVTEPDIHSGKQAKEFAQKLQKILRYLEVTDADMEKGSMRLEANISWGLNLGYKVEVKNLNSFRFVEKAVNYELERQKKLLEEGKTPRQETRGWSEKLNKTTVQRYKETSADYRYFPEPDIPPMEFTKDYIVHLKQNQIKLPDEVEDKFISVYNISADYAKILSSNKALAEYAFEALESTQKEKVAYKDVISAIINKKININKTKPDELVKKIALKQNERIDDEKLLSMWVNSAIDENKMAIKDYRSGKESAIQVIIGSVMKDSKGKADAIIAKNMIIKKLKR